MLRGLRHIFLDMDGTLCYYGLTYDEAAHQVLKRHGLANVELPIEEEYYRIYDEVYAEDWSQPFEAISVEAFRRMLLGAGVGDVRVASEVAMGYRKAREASLQLYDEVPEALAALALHIPLALITNGPSDIQRMKVRILGLEPYFRSILVSGELEFEKPDARIFQKALGLMGADPAATAHVGDSLEYDVAGANGAGLVSVWVNRARAKRGAGGPRPTAEVFDLWDLLRLLGLAEGGKASVGGEA